MSGVPSNMLGRSIVDFQYTNWRGETAVRKVVPDRVVWMDDPDYGYKPGWFLIGWDIKRGAMRQFSFDPERMKPIDDMSMGPNPKAVARTPLSSYGVNILLQVR